MDQALKTMLENIKKNSGKPVEHWVSVVQQSGLEKHGEKLKLLKEKHGFTHGFANTIVMMSKKDYIKPGDNTDILIENQYKGKESLRPIYYELIKKISKFGKDLEIAPKKSYVSLRRKKQFALIVPATKTRIDLGLALKGDAANGRLETYNAMCSHRVRLESEKDFDKDVKTWMKEACSRSG